MTENPPGAENDGRGFGVPPFLANAAADAAADLPRRATEAVTGLVDLIHDKAVRPIVLVARIAVYSLLIGVLALMVLVCVCVGLLRLLDVYAFGHRVWLSYTLVGGIFSAVGLWLMIRAAKRGEIATT